ncbi:MAG TPA: hypothetical protein VF798_03565, partial [Burkholderiaceae bacterium]
MHRIVGIVMLCLALCATAHAASSCPAGTVYVKGDSAAFVTESVPNAMAYGKSYPVSITFCNNGSTTWSYAAPPPGGNYAGTNRYIRLGAIVAAGTNPWGLLRTDLSPGDVIAPGSTKTFNFNVTAPSAATSSKRTPFQWAML